MSTTKQQFIDEVLQPIADETTRIAGIVADRDQKIKDLLAQIAAGGGSWTAEEETAFFDQGKALVTGLKGIGNDATNPVPNPVPEPTPEPTPGDTGGEG
jgi:hypothetical protein